MRFIIKNIIFLSLFFVSFFLSNISVAQEVEIRLGKKNIALNEYFTITLVVKNANFETYSDFPNIQGFVKRSNPSSRSSTNIINGRRSQEISLTQNYQAKKEGTILIKPFEVEINGVAVPNNGGKIKVGPAKQRQQQTYRDPFADFFGRGNSQPQEYYDVEDDAFFAISTNKKEVYSGEGFPMTIAFYISEKNKAQMDFHDISNQISTIIQKAKPKNCWEENFEIKEIRPEEVEINGKRYTQYKFYQAVLYPLNNEDVVIPSIGLKMIKYKVAKQQSFFGRNHQKDFKTFYSKAKNIKVKELPPHPLKEQVAVGNYRLIDGISKTEFKTGESFNYKFKIIGEGNISAIKEPTIINDDRLQFYPPNELQDINRSEGMVTGKKIFDYYIIPDEPGNFNLGDYTSWIYFNPKKEVYDTLMPDFTFTVNGKSKKNTTIRSTDLGNFYDRIPFEDTTLRVVGGDIDYYFWIKLILVLMTIIVAFIYFKK